MCVYMCVYVYIYIYIYIYIRRRSMVDSQRNADFDLLQQKVSAAQAPRQPDRRAIVYV